MSLAGLRSPWLVVVAAPFAGSFLALVADRLPAGRPILLGRSACDACGRTLGPGELAPLLSFALQGGRCRGCGSRIPRRLPVIEALALLIGAIAAQATPEQAWAGAALGWTLLALAMIDVEHGVLPDPLTLGLLLLGLAVAAIDAGGPPTGAAIGALVGLGAFGAIAALYPRVRGRAGLGWGDVKLFGAAGAWVGWEGLPEVMLIAAATGIAAVLARRVIAAVPLDRAIPFGPMLALGIWATWLIVTLGASD